MKPQPPELPVFCGGLTPPDDAVGALVLDTDAPPGSPGEVNLNLGSLTRAMVADLPDRLADLIEIAAYVYCADQFSPRDTPLMRDLGAAWRRSFRFEMPVRDLPFWSRTEVQDALVGVLGFLSEDALRVSASMPCRAARRSFARFLDSEPSQTRRAPASVRACATGRSGPSCSRRARLSAGAAETPDPAKRPC